MPENRKARRLGYALNAFPYHTLAELWHCLESDVPQIKDRLFANEPFPIELRFSEPIVRELENDCDAVARLKHFLDTRDLELVTVNAFVLPRFHGEPVKEKVYLPAWHESEARLRFTNASVDLISQLYTSPLQTPQSGAEPMLSVSVPFGALKPIAMEAIAPRIGQAGEHAQQVHQRTGTRVVVGLEPEPGLTVETTEEVLTFFERHVPARLRPYLGVTFDLSHQLVEFENLADSVRRLVSAGITIAKVHVTNAAELGDLKPFYNDSIYLHQTTGCDAQGRRAWFSLDWPQTQPPSGLVRYRVHYHLPVYPSEVPSTIVAVEDFLRDPSIRGLDPATPFIIETYTWPQQLGGQTGLIDNICRELEWVRSKI